jgi:hypothetical protein
MSWFSLVLSTLVALSPPPDELEVRALAPVEAAQPAPRDVRVIEAGKFRIAHTERAAGAARMLATTIGPLRQHVEGLLGRDWPGTTEVRIGLGREEYEAMALPGGRPPTWAVALAYPRANIILVEAHSVIDGSGMATLAHEMVHVALGQLGQDWPHWYQEGLAQQLSGERTFQMGQFGTMARAVFQERVFDFDDLTEAFPADPQDVEIAYAQSVAFLQFLKARHPSSAFDVLFDRMRVGDPFEKAFGVAFHSPLSVEERAFREELPRWYPLWAYILAGGSLTWIVATVLLVGAYFRQRRRLTELRAERRRIEHLEDVVDTIVARSEAPANDDAPSDEAGPVFPHRPWLVRSYVTRHAPREASLSEDLPRRRNI